MGHLVTTLAQSRIIVQDGFNRPDNASSLGRADTGQTWQPLVGTWGIIGNQTYCVSDTDNDSVVIETGRSNYKISLLCSGQLDTVNRSIPCLIFRVLDASNYLMCQVNQGVLELYKRVGGAFTQIGNFAVTIGAGVPFTIAAVCNGNLVEVYLNGVRRITSTLSGGDTVFATYTKAGFRYGKAGAPTIMARFDNFSVEAL